MIWGETTAEKAARLKRERRGPVWEWHIAPRLWFPVRLVDGRRSWLERLERCASWASHLPLNATQGRLGWVYRLRQD